MRAALRAAGAVTVTVCQTDPSTSLCFDPAQSRVDLTIDAGATPTFGVFVSTAESTIAFDTPPTPESPSKSTPPSAP